ncbi:MAG: 50S ribosomal protein L25 [Candidatus Paceibacterota bacterium]
MIQLHAQIRTVFKKAVATLLAQDIIPAEIYGHNFENKHISVSRKDFKKAYAEAGETGVIMLTVDAVSYPVLVHETKTDRLGNAIVSIDFYAVNLKEKTTAEIPLHIIGESPAIKEFNGVMIKALEEVEVEALPADLPSHIDIDVTQLVSLNQSIHVKDISVPKTVKILTDPDAVIVVITEPKVEEEVAPTVTEEVVSPVTPSEGSNEDK